METTCVIIGIVIVALGFGYYAGLFWFKPEQMRSNNAGMMAASQQSPWWIRPSFPRLRLKWYQTGCYIWANRLLYTVSTLALLGIALWLLSL